MASTKEYRDYILEQKLDKKQPYGRFFIFPWLDRQDTSNAPSLRRALGEPGSNLAGAR